MFGQNAQVEAINEFNNARRQARLQLLSAQLRGEEKHLLPFDELRQRLRLGTALYRGVEDIPLDQIVGSVGRHLDFTRQFLPVDDNAQSRWVNIRALATTQGWLPIELYKLGNAYFVRDGNHRVSVAREMGLPTIEAHVWEYPEELEIGPNDTLDEVLIRYGERNFMAITGLDTIYPDHGIRLTAPGRYTELLAQIEDLQITLSLIDGEELPYEEAVAAWYEMSYLPVVQIIEEAEMMGYFPERTQTDLFVWLSIHRQELGERYGEYENLLELAEKIVAEFEEGGFGRLTRRVRRLFGQDVLSPAEQLDKELLAVAAAAKLRKEQMKMPAFLSETPTTDYPIQKSYTQSGNYCRVTFTLPSKSKAKNAYLVGEFNNWDKTAEPMTATESGGFTTTISLPTGNAYRFRYFIDGERWENDWGADAYMPNVYGSDDSVVWV